MAPARETGGVKPQVKINVLRDVVEIFRTQLVQVGYSAKDVYGIAGDEELLTAYYNATRRIVGAWPRTVHRAIGFVSPKDKDQARALATIEQKIRNGESVVPYLSRKIRDLSYNDILFNDWGIHHFHLGTTVEADGFVKRTGPLLYVVFGDTIDFHNTGNTDAHLLTVMGHNDFATQVLVEIMHENWPELLSQFNTPGVNGDRLSDAEIRRLRELHTNYCLRLRDGTSCFAPGGGITFAGTSMIDTFRAMHRVWWAEKQQEIVLGYMPGVIEREMTSGQRRFKKVIDLRLRISNDATEPWILVDENSGYLHPLLSIG